MILLFSAIISILGLVNLVSRQTLIGVLIGIQLLFSGAASGFVIIGRSIGVLQDGLLFSLVICLVGFAQIVLGWCFCVVVFRSTRGVEMDSLNQMKDRLR